MTAAITTTNKLSYPFDKTPAYGTALEIAPGVKWLQMPLPMSLNHINLYLIEEESGWVIVDTGIRGKETTELWHKIFTKELNGKPVSKIICTHMHPDHTGQSGFLHEHWQAPLYMSYSEFYQASFINMMMRQGGGWRRPEHYLRAGFSKAFLSELGKGSSSFTPEPEDAPMPSAFVRLVDGEKLQLGQHEWQIITGTGHSPEHVCLYCPSLRLLISGDQVLPVITSNVSVYHTEPEANPMKGWLESHRKFKASLPDDLLVLPAHNQPFYGLHERLDQLIEHHEDRMLILEENCLEPQIAVDLLPLLFARKLEGHVKVMALGECIAHLHCLMDRDRIERTLENGVYRYRSIDPSLSQRARPGQHEPPDERPEIT